MFEASIQRYQLMAVMLYLEKNSCIKFTCADPRRDRNYVLITNHLCKDLQGSIHFSQYQILF